jgi:hypothetical protein
MPQGLGPCRSVASPDPLGVAITDIEQLCRLAQTQLASFHSAQHFAPSQLFVVHPCPFQSGSSFGALD